jgi:2-iminobutanoate/2-iminopropanoate deaminase
VEHEAVKTNKANPPAGPYNQGIKWNGLVFTASVGTTNPTYGAAPPGDVRTAARNALENVKAILEEAGSDLEHVLHVTLYLNDIADFDAINEVYTGYFTGIRPARSLVRVGGPRGTCSFDAVGYVPSQST